MNLATDKGGSGQYVHVGCGFTAGDAWVNFDASPTLRIERIPLVGKTISRLFGDGEPFPRSARYGDIVKGLPLEEGSSAAIFASHVLEHLSLDDMRTGLKECYRVLAPGGRIRIIVPDLEARARRYLQAREAGEPGASMDFMDTCYLGQKSRPRSVLSHLRAALGNSKHLWMWDEGSMSRELERAGFINVRRVQFGDSGDPKFDQVERRDRYIDDGIVEVALEAKKPS